MSKQASATSSSSWGTSPDNGWDTYVCPSNSSWGTPDSGRNTGSGGEHPSNSSMGTLPDSTGWDTIKNSGWRSSMNSGSNTGKNVL